MGHRKFNNPRNGNLGFLPKKRAAHLRGRVRHFPVDDKSQAPHLTAFPTYKAGMTHIVRELDRAGSKAHKKEVCEPVTIVEAPDIVCVGVVGYKKTARGMKTIGTVWAAHLGETARRRFYKRWYCSKKKAFTKYEAQYASKEAAEAREKTLGRMKKDADVVRALIHTQPNLLKIGVKKAYFMEVQVNGGEAGAKVDFVTGLFEKTIAVGTVFNESEQCDAIGVTRGHGFEGVVHRWGVTRLPRKTHRGLRKVACIGCWHPTRLGYYVARPGQNGMHHRTELNKKIYRIGKAVKDDPENGSCEQDITKKPITPLGGFMHYGVVTNQFVMLKGSCPGPVKRLITLRRPLAPQTNRAAQCKISLKFIDTSSKIGHGHFQTTAERAKFMGPTKKTLAQEAAKASK
jgi:large subunit ribosomal protein L3e